MENNLIGVNGVYKTLSQFHSKISNMEPITRYYLTNKVRATLPGYLNRVNKAKIK
jgi:hypothetical protein